MGHPTVRRRVPKQQETHPTMRISFFSTALSVLGVVWTVCGVTLQAQMIVPMGDDVASRADVAPGRVLYEQWELDLALAGRDSVAGATIIDDQIFVTTADDRVYAIDAANGFVKWIYHLPQTVFHYRAPVKVITVDNDGPVVLVMRTLADVVDRDSGRLIERVALPLSAGGSVVADACRMYVGGADGMLVALNWNPACGRESGLAWRVRLDGPVASAPVLGIDGSLYVATTTGQVYAADAHSKRFHWRFSETDAVVGQLIVHATGVDVASFDRKLLVLDPVTGDLLAGHRFSSRLTEGPAAWGNQRFQYCEDEGVSAFAVGGHGRAWTAPKVRSILSGDDDRLLARGIDGSVRILNAMTGETIDSVSLSPGLRVVRGSTADAVFVVSSGARITRASMFVPDFRRGSGWLGARDRVR